MILFSIVSSLSLISYFNSSNLTGVALVGTDDDFRDRDEVLLVLFLFVFVLRTYKYSVSCRRC